MAKTHYEVLGVARTASADQIRSAYRKLVLQHHPDHSKEPASKAIFLAATASYEVLADVNEKRRYDEKLARQNFRNEPSKNRGQQIPRPPSGRSGPTAPRGASVTADRGAPRTTASIAEEIQKLTKLYQTGRTNDAETKARDILKMDSRQPMPYAILGDIARSRGNNNEAAKMYAYAMQMDPRNELYERRYREVLDRSRVVGDQRHATLEPADKKIIVPMIGSAIVIMNGIYLMLSQEAPVLSWLPIVSTWTVGSLVTLFITGITVGASLSIGNLVDRYGEVSITSTGRVAPTTAMGCLSLVQFWLAAALYGAVGLIHRSWNVSMTRLIAGVGSATLFMSVAACLREPLDPLQFFFWGGNIIYVGALCGWIVADAFR